MDRGTVVDLFCGAGGLSEGFRQAGFRVLAGSDFDDTAGKTFAATHPEATFLGGRIQDLTVEHLLEVTGLKPGELDVLVGGPPCQGYSVYNHQRGVDDPRAGLFREYLRIVKGLKPRWIVMENVSGLTSIADGGIVREIQAGMKELGYVVDFKILKAEEYGVPQERRRIFFIANRVGAPIVFPTPTHGKDLKPFVTIWDAIGDLPVVENGQGEALQKYATAPANSYQAELRGNRKSVADHSAPKLGGVNLARLKHIPSGGSWRDIPFDPTAGRHEKSQTQRSHEAVWASTQVRPRMHHPHKMRHSLGRLHPSATRSRSDRARGCATAVVPGPF